MPTPTTIGAGGYAHGFGTTITDTTTSAVTAGNKVIAFVAWWGGAGGALSSVSGGGLSWTIDQQGSGSSYRCALVSADAPAGMASSTVITATFSVTSEDRQIRMVQVDGLDTTTADGSAFLPVTGTGSFSIALTVGTTGDFVLGAGWTDGDFTGATWTAPATEIGTDWSNSGGGGSGSYSWAYKTSVSAGAQAMAGTYLGNFAGVAAAYKVSGGGGGAARTKPKVYNQAAIRRASLY